MKLAFFTFTGMLILGSGLYVTYRYSQSRSRNIILPGGTTYLGETPTPIPITSPTPTTPAIFTAASDVAWKTRSGKIYPYSFSYPSTLNLVIFPDDLTDSVAIEWKNIPPQLNILANIELIEDRDKTYVKKPKIEYAKNWYKFFPGLTGVGKVQKFTNVNGLKGYKVWFVNKTGSSPNLDVFFEIPGKPNLMIHMANGIIDSPIFDRMIDSLKWNTSTMNK